MRARKRLQHVPARRKRGLRAELPFRILLLLIFLLTLLLGIFSQSKEGISDLLPEQSPAEKEEIDPSASSSAATFPVYISGAVNAPGVYDMNEGDIVAQLLEKAGGFSAEASRDGINLAALLLPNSQVFVPIISENKILAEALPSDGGTLLDLNLCSSEELQNIPGIGPKTAEAIIGFRSKAGRRIVLEDLLQVPGIKEKKLERIRPYFRP